MDEIEKKLKILITNKYKSLPEFSWFINMPYADMLNLLKTDMAKADKENLIKICKALNIDADCLIKGEIVPIREKKNENRNQVTAITRDGKCIQYTFTDEKMQAIITILDGMK